MQDIRRHWSLVAWLRGMRGVLFRTHRCEGFAGFVPAGAEAANDSGPRAA